MVKSLRQKELQAMDIKRRPNHRIYIKTLRQMGPEAGLLKVFELSDFSRALFLHGLRKRPRDLSDEALRKLYLERIDKCHNRNY
jgi:hypothetical protein